MYMPAVVRARVTVRRRRERIANAVLGAVMAAGFADRSRPVVKVITVDTDGIEPI